MPKQAFDDLMSQQERIPIDDPLGLYTVLKNIQSRKCSCGFLCIEIGTIYGDFDNLKPKNITIPYKEEQKIHTIIKPIIIVNTTEKKRNDSDVTPMIDIFEKVDDCDELSISGNYNKNFKFKQVEPEEVIKIQRKFYRKVSAGNSIYSKDTFKQGLNLIIAERNKRYTKGKIFYNKF
jgi:hypothetical protein